jgi:predicted nuclease of predicted toxin-antitoxin system
LRFLIDANLSPVVAARCRDDGHDAVHVADVGLLTASDEAILSRAGDEERVVISADSDFGTLLAVGHLSKPSFVLLRSADHLAPRQQADLVLGHLPQVGDDLAVGAIVTIAHLRVRVRSLPITDEG